MQKRTISLIVIAIIIILIGGYSIDRRNSKSTTATSGSSVTATSTTQANVATDTISSTSVGVAGQGQGTVKILPNTTAAKAPDYTKSIIFSASVTPSVKAAIQSQFNITVAAITKEKYDFSAWIDLGSLHHMVGDDMAAATIWEYASLTWPTNVSSFNNLGDLYTNYLKNYPKAESNFLIAIKNKPNDTNPYRNLYTLYYDAGYNKAKAEGILKQAIAAVPKAVDMQVLLARYYRDNGRTAEAKTVYAAAVANAQSQGQTSLATSIQAEAAAI